MIIQINQKKVVLSSEFRGHPIIFREQELYEPADTNANNAD